MTAHRFAVSILTAAIGASTLVGGAGAGAFASEDWVIKSRVENRSNTCGDPGKQRSVTRLGPIRITPEGRRSPTKYPNYSVVRRAIGLPDRLVRPNESEAIGIWTGRRAARMDFVTFGGPTDLKSLPFQYADLTGKKWVTSRGIRVGSTARKMKAAYGREAWRLPKNRVQPGNWWRLSGSCSALFTDQDDQQVTAKIRRNRIIKFRVWIGAAGE